MPSGRRMKMDEPVPSRRSGGAVQADFVLFASLFAVFPTRGEAIAKPSDL